MSKLTRPVMIMAGGTGGHIFPALAVAEALQARNVPVIWLGSAGGMETRIVPTYGIPMETLSIKGLRGKGLMPLLTAPLKLSRAVIQALRLLRRHQPRSVLGMGGFASGPGGLAAVLLRVPLYVHEQNAIPGMTNRWLAKFSRGVMQGFAGAFAGRIDALHTGNPVRGKIVSLAAPQQRYAGRSGAIRLLVVGGSLGAMKFNQVVPATLAGLEPSQRPSVLHQTGEKNLEMTRQAYTKQGVEAEVVSFIHDMAEAYAEADLVIARAGALTVTELEQAGVAAVLVPYPHAVDDHQTANASALVAAGAAVLIHDANLSVETLTPVLQQLTSNREVLSQMAQAGHALARPFAAEHVARICLGESPDAVRKNL